MKVTVRCSELGKAMSRTRDRKTMGDTAKRVFINSFNRQAFQKYAEFSSKQTEKGDLCEPEAVIFISEKTGYVLSKYDGPELRNDWITGTPDALYLTKGIVDHVHEVKNSYTSESHFNKWSDGLSAEHKAQVKGYCFLNQVGTGTVHHCLMNSPETQVNDALKNQYFKSKEDPELWEEIYTIGNMMYDRKSFIQMCERLGRLPVDKKSLAMFRGFVEIPEELRYFKFDVEFTSEDEKQIIESVNEGNRFLQTQEFYKLYLHSCNL
jgi:hypothetical protein